MGAGWRSGAGPARRGAPACGGRAAALNGFAMSLPSSLRLIAALGLVAILGALAFLFLREEPPPVATTGVDTTQDPAPTAAPQDVATLPPTIPASRTATETPTEPEAALALEVRVTANEGTPVPAARLAIFRGEQWLASA